MASQESGTTQEKEVTGFSSDRSSEKERKGSRRSVEKAIAPLLGSYRPPQSEQPLASKVPPVIAHVLYWVHRT